MKVKAQKKIYHAILNKKNAEVAILTSVKQTSEKRKSPGTKNNITQQYKDESTKKRTSLNGLHQTRVLKYTKQKLIQLQGETDKPTVIIGDFNTLLSAIDRSTKQKIRKDIKELKNNIH